VVTETEAEIIDFKTDDLSAAGARAEKVKGYTPQLMLYRQAVSRLTGLPLKRIRCTLVFTQLESRALESLLLE
jgi:ATP-dependent helicase/nuclease subunit A